MFLPHQNQPETYSQSLPTLQCLGKVLKFIKCPHKPYQSVPPHAMRMFSITGFGFFYLSCENAAGNHAKVSRLSNHDGHYPDQATLPRAIWDAVALFLSLSLSVTTQDAAACCSAPCTPIQMSTLGSQASVRGWGTWRMLHSVYHQQSLRLVLVSRMDELLICQNRSLPTEVPTRLDWVEGICVDLASCCPYLVICLGSDPQLQCKH